MDGFRQCSPEEDAEMRKITAEIFNFTRQYPPKFAANALILALYSYIANMDDPSSGCEAIRMAFEHYKKDFQVGQHK